MTHIKINDTNFVCKKAVFDKFVYNVENVFLL